MHFKGRMGSENSLLTKFIVHSTYLLCMAKACMHEKKNAYLQVEPFWFISSHQNH